MGVTDIEPGEPAFPVLADHRIAGKEVLDASPGRGCLHALERSGSETHGSQGNPSGGSRQPWGQRDIARRAADGWVGVASKLPSAVHLAGPIRPVARRGSAGWAKGRCSAMYCIDISD